MLTTLTKLAPYENEISGTIPTEIGVSLGTSFCTEESPIGSYSPLFPQLLTALTGIEFDITQVTGSIPTELGLLTDLEEFYAFESFVTGTIPTEIGVSTAEWFVCAYIEKCDAN